MQSYISSLFTIIADMGWEWFIVHNFMVMSYFLTFVHVQYLQYS